MIDYVIKNIHDPLMDDVKVDMGVDKPLVSYVMKAIKGLENLNILRLYPIEGAKELPFVVVDNWVWDPHPPAERIQTRRRETGDKLSTKPIGNSRLGILEFDIYCGARDKNKKIVENVVHNEMFIPIEDDHGRYMLDNILYSEYQLVDKLLYPSGKNSITLKSLLPIVIKYEETTVTSLNVLSVDDMQEVTVTSKNGHIYYAKIGMVKIFTTMEPIMSCFMHIPAPLCYLGVYPILEYVDKISNDTDQYDYFQPIPDTEIYIKGYKKGLDKFDYVRSILAMSMHLIKKHKPADITELKNPQWWIYKLSYHDNVLEHRGACHQMHVSRMLDTISANELPIPENDKRNMTSLLRYVLQTEFDDINIYSMENKRLRLNEVISTIVTAEVSVKLKRMFKFGTALQMKDLLQILTFNPQLILKNMYKLGTVHVTDFANDLDYYQQLRYTKKG